VRGLRWIANAPRFGDFTSGGREYGIEFAPTVTAQERLLAIGAVYHVFKHKLDQGPYLGDLVPDA
jgi:hypothetical protein